MDRRETLLQIYSIYTLTTIAATWELLIEVFYFLFSLIELNNNNNNNNNNNTFIVLNPKEFRRLLNYPRE